MRSGSGSSKVTAQPPARAGAAVARTPATAATSARMNLMVTSCPRYTARPDGVPSPVAPDVRPQADRALPSGDLPSAGGVPFPQSTGGQRVPPGLDVRGLDAEACQDGADLLPMGVSVVERLRDDDTGADTAGPFAHEDHPFRVDRLGKELLPELLRLLDPCVELVEIGALVAVHP